MNFIGCTTEIMFERGLLCWLAVASLSSLCCCTVTTIPAGHALHNALHHFEVLHKHHLNHRISVRGHRTLIFSTLDRKFELSMTSRKGLFAEGLEVNSVGASGEMRRHVMDVNHFFTGSVEDEVGSKVSAHFDEREGILTASILTNTDHYFIEPSYRHFSQSHDFHMISYRASDLKYNMTGKSSHSYCGTDSAPPPFYAPSQFPLPPQSNPSFTESARLLRKRQSTRALTLDSCPMFLVATANFHGAYSKNHGVENTILFMVQVIGDIDQNIFRPVEWETGVQDFGLTIQNITVYESRTTDPPYNALRPGGWESGQMLRLFSHSDWSSYCLAHLFAFQQFTDNLVGVAYPASPDENSPGGICSPALPNFNGGAIATANVGVSSYRGGDGRVLLLAEARLITSHEIGHNWGSEHDPTGRIGPCNPELSTSGGKFLMFPSMSDGTQPNNDAFSSCSRAFISSVLRSKSPNCFTGRVETRCGNYEVERGEECDAGLRGMLGRDDCCNAQCRLKDNKTCSDSNHICCANCSVSGPSTVCRSFPLLNQQCYANVTCDGVNKACPTETELLPVNSTCRGKGTCLYNGTACDTNGECTAPPSSPFNAVECYNFCRLHNREQCFCPSSSGNECHFCCQARINETMLSNCTVFPGLERLPDGTSCVGGLCMAGRCRPRVQDLINRLFDLFTDISIDKFVQFLEENIVGSVVFITAVIWIIVGSIVHCYDIHHFKEYRKRITEMEEERLGNCNEDHLDNTFLDDMAYLTPEIDSHRTRRGLSRMGSRNEFSVGGGSGYTHQYSIGSGYDRVIHGRRLSSVLEQSKKMDPSSSNIMQHILSQSASAGKEGLV